MIYCGIVLPRHVFALLPINNGMALARVMYIAGSYWGLVLISICLGLNWGLEAGKQRESIGGEHGMILQWIMRLAAAAIAGYGAFCIHPADAVS